MPDILWTILAVVVCLPVGVLIGILYRKRVAEAKIGSAEQEAKRIVAEALKTSETKKKELLLEAKEEILRAKNEADREIKERRREITNTENRMAKKEEALDRKSESLERKEELLAKKISEVEAQSEEIKRLIAEQRSVLERLAGLTCEQAKEELLRTLDEELQHETAMKISAYEQQFKEEAELRAKSILSLAIQRCAADHVSEMTVSVVNLPNEEMKGRIIGREGRNVRTIETLTGVDLIIDDTPEAVILSSFDPVRREVARIALEKLILDGRIHPTRIEEMVEKARNEVEATIKAEGERAVLETGLHGVNPELIKILGRLRYRTSYGQNVLAHSIEVAYIAGLMASELGVDPVMARRAGLLHDIGKAIDHETDGTHVSIGVDLARKFRENEQVIHAIEAHHGDVEPKSYIAVLVQAADAISAARPGARRENVQTYIKRLEKLEEIASSFEGVEKSYAMQAGREIRVMVQPEAVDDAETHVMAKEIAKQVEAELTYPGTIRITVVRESRATELAR